MSIDEEFNRWISQQSNDRLQVAIDRAIRKFPYEVEFSEDGIPLLDEEDALAVIKEMHAMWVDDTLTSLSHKGYITPSVDTDGELLYELTEKGENEVR